MRTVYIHTTPDGKKYVGATHMNPDTRFKRGLGYRYQFFYQAVLEFGWENITHQLYEVDTEEELKYLEKYLIAYYDTTNPEKGYNIAKGDLTQDQGRDHPEYGKSDNYPRRKEVCHKYFISDKGKETLKRYYNSEKRKETHERYYNSEKGQEVIKRYRTSNEGKESQKRSRQRYNASEKGKEKIKRYNRSEARKLENKRYRETEKGKAARKKYDSSEKGKASHKLTMKRWYEKKKKQMKNE